MATMVEIPIGESFAERHEQFTEQLGDQYQERMRQLLEDEVHTVTQELERQAEQQVEPAEAVSDVEEN